MSSTLCGHAEQFQVLTRSYGNQRTGANVSEKILKPATLKSGNFGKLFMLPVDDEIYAGLLYAADVSIAGGKHNILYVATVNNSVYAFDADKLGAPLWYRNFNGAGRPTRNTEVGQACRIYHDFRGNIGIIGTPVIGPDHSMYFVTRTVEYGTTVQRLHAIDITNGQDRAASPQVIAAKMQGKGDGSIGGVVSFDPITENQRPALALSNGTVYIGWASFCDTRPYHGWMMAYDAKTLAQAGVFNTSPNGNMAGIWMSGAGPALDAAGNLYVTTGNGTFDGKTEFGESIIKLQAKSLHVLDYFTPSNFNTLNDFDLDFGTQGPTMLPGSNLMVVGGKEGKMYVVDATKMGTQVPGDIQITQEVQAADPTIRPTLSHHMHNAIPVWKSLKGTHVYVWGESDFLRAYRLNPANGKFSASAAVGKILAPAGMPGGMLTVSSDGARSGTGILWATLPLAGDANHATVPGDLYAFDADSLDLLWSSTGAGDDPLSFAKGSPAVVVNGKVYVASLSRFVSVYGLRKSSQSMQNMAFKAQATGSEPCDASETPDKAVNGSAETGPADKWCSSAPTPYLQADLGRSARIGRIVIEHAGAGGEDFTQNTRDFSLQVSLDGASFTTVATVRDNDQSITAHDFAPMDARYVRLSVKTPGDGGVLAANVYEMQVYPPAPAYDSGDALVDDPAPTPLVEVSIAPSPVNPNSANHNGNQKSEVTRTGRVISPPADVATAPSDAQTTQSGLGMKVLQQGNGTDHPSANDCVNVSFVAWKTDGHLFSTSTSMNDSDLLCLNDAIAGVAEAVRQMVPGEKVRLWIPEDLTFHEGHHHIQHRPEDEEPPHKDLTFDLQLLSIVKAPPTPTDLKQPPETATKGASGVSYQVLKTGTGSRHPSANDKVTVHYSCWRGDGRLFESTVTGRHPAQVNLATAIPMWREAVSHMLVGEKTRFWIPAALAYGEKPVEGFSPAGDLVYEIELLSID